MTNARETKASWTRMYWPLIDTEISARQASRQGFWAAIFCASMTALFAALGAFGVDLGPKLRLDIWAMVDASVWGVIALGLWRGFRPAAWAGLFFYGLERAYAWSTVGPGNPVVAILITLAFVNGLRGTLAMHRFKSAIAAGQGSADPLVG